MAGNTGIDPSVQASGTALAPHGGVMVHRWRRIVLSARRLLARLFAAAIGIPLLACGSAVGEGETASGTGADVTGTGGGAGAAPMPMSDGSGAVGSGGSGGTGAVVIDIPTNCTTPDTSDIELAEQMVDARLPVHRVLYSWTTAEQEAGLRDGARLFSVGVVDGKGRGIALDALFAFAEQNPDSLEAQLTVLFDKARYAWPNPWATRMGFGTESYGDRLLKIVLSEEAWIARLSPAGTVADVWDLEGAPVAPEDVAATPERIAAFFFVRTSEAGPQCGSFFGGTGGYREFVLGNLEMVDSYEIGSQAILDRIDSDISALTEYLEVVRPCPPALGNNFNAAVFCNWGYTGDPYLESLSLPDDPYVPTAANLTTIIETLTADRFTPDPFTVTLE